MVSPPFLSMPSNKRTITVPGEFLDIVEETLDMRGGRAKHFVETFLEEFDGPESWFVGFRDMEEDKPVIQNIIKKFYWKSYKYRYDRQTMRNIS